jgi:hypothetical protein
MLMGNFRRTFVLWVMGLVTAGMTVSHAALAQPSGMCDGCSGMMGGGMGGMMWVGMILVWLLGIAAIAALVAVAVYLFRRSGLR